MSVIILKNIRHFIIKIKINLSRNSTPVYISKLGKMCSQKDMYINVHGNFFTIDKKSKSLLRIDLYCDKFIHWNTMWQEK